MKSYAAEYGFSGAILHPFNVYGAFEKGINAMTSLVERAINGEEFFISGTGKNRFVVGAI